MVKISAIGLFTLLTLAIALSPGHAYVVATGETTTYGSQEVVAPPPAMQPGAVSWVGPAGGKHAPMAGPYAGPVMGGMPPKMGVAKCKPAPMACYPPMPCAPPACGPMPCGPMDPCAPPMCPPPCKRPTAWY